MGQQTMGKSKQKTHSEVEYLRGLVRELKSENRHIKKKLKHAERKEHNYDGIITQAFENGDIEIKITNKPMCPNCGKFELEEIDLKHLIIKRCLLCKHEERIRNN